MMWTLDLTACIHVAPAADVANHAAAQANVADFGVFIDVGTPRHALLHQNQYKVSNSKH